MITWPLADICDNCHKYCNQLKFNTCRIEEDNGGDDDEDKDREDDACDKNWLCCPVTGTENTTATEVDTGMEVDTTIGPVYHCCSG